MSNQTGDSGSDEHVHFVVQLDAHPDERNQLIAAQREFQNVASRFPGFLSAEIKESSSDLDRAIRLVGIYSFVSAETLVRWIESDERRTLMKRFDDNFGERIEIHYPDSIAGFTAFLPHTVHGIGMPSTPPRWKMSLVVLAALYPLVVALGIWIPRWLPRATKPSLQLVIAAIAVATMGFALIPAIAWMMKAWLATERWTGHLVGSLLLVAMIFVVWYLAH